MTDEKMIEEMRAEFDLLLGQYKNLETNYNGMYENYREYAIENNTLKQELAQARKETAREILKATNYK